MSSFKQLWVVTGAAAGGLVLAQACADGGGEVLVDAGELLRDAGALLADAGPAPHDGDAALDGDGSSGEGGLLADAGEMLRDAGAVLVDAGARLSDGAVRDAAAAGGSLAHQSGSRIEMRVSVQTGDDGSVFAGYGPQPYDKQLGVSCTILTAADGAQRCLPSSASTLSELYSDSACRNPLAAARGCDGASFAYATRTEYVGCGAPRLHVFPVQAVYNGSRFYALDNGSCQAVTASAGSYASVGAELPASTFVAFSASTTVL